MITSMFFILFGLIGSIGGLIFLVKNPATTDEKRAPSSKKPKQTAVIGSICCHGLLILTGVLVFREFSLPPSWLFILCTLTVLSRVLNGYILFKKIQWTHHLISAILLGISVFFYLD